MVSFLTIAPRPYWLVLAFCLALLVSGCGRKPGAVDTPSGAVATSYPPAEEAPAAP